MLGDAAWATATPIEGFVQEQPVEGAPVSEKTEVRVIFTKDTLYIGAVMYDREPRASWCSDSRRDAPLDDVDSFRIIFDTYRDRQNGFVFGTNPAGVEYDGQSTLEGQGGGGISGGGMQGYGSGGGFNVNWDGAWQVRTKTTDIGWSAEFAIPFKHAALSRLATEPDLGRQLPAHHPPSQRARLLGADSRGSSTSTGCRWPASISGIRTSVRPQPQADAVRARQRHRRRACGRWTASRRAKSAAT